MSRLKKFTLRLDPADVAVLKKAYPRQGSYARTYGVGGAFREVITKALPSG